MPASVRSAARAAARAAKGATAKRTRKGAFDRTVRIDSRTNSILDTLARERGEAKKEILARAVERLRRDEILGALNAGYAAMKSDPKAWQSELDERTLWETTNSDGLEDE